MPDFKRRDFLAATLAAAAGGSEMASWSPFGPKPLDPRQPKMLPVDPRPVKPMYRQPAASPVHLSGSLVLRSGTSGAVPTAALKNPMGQDMEILEIKFEISGSNPSTSSAVFGGCVWCELLMGSIKITNGAIPCWNFARSENPSGEMKTDTTNSLKFVSYSWRLPRPLFVPAGAVLAPIFTHTGFVPGSLNVRIGYSARTVFTKPKVYYVPWVAKYASKVFNPITTAGVDLSSELDLVNSNPEVLHLQRLTGRVMMLQGSVKNEFFPQAFGSQFLTMRMSDSYGRPIVGNYAPFNSVFSPVSRSWEMDNGASLDPDAYYTVNLKADAMTMDVTGYAGQAFIGMVGWREMERL